MTRRIGISLTALLVPVAIAVSLLARPTGTAAAVDERMIAKIKDETMQRSAVMDTLSWLSDVYGPRLTGSPTYNQAAEWARRRLGSWGAQHAALESIGSVGRGWVLDRFSIEMTAPQYMRITGFPRAWSPPTTVPLVGTPMVITLSGPPDFPKYRGKLRGAIVMAGRPAAEDIGFKPEATRYSDDDLKKAESQTDPAAPIFDYTTKSYWDDAEQFHNELARMRENWQFLADEGIAALVVPSSTPEAVVVAGFYDRYWQSPYPAFVLAREQYGRIVRMVDREQPVTLSLSLTSHFIDDAEGFNVIAEIPGTDPRVKDEVVMLGGHLDSWHTGTGATDNGAGCAVAMEAVRILEAVSAKPRRTIRIALWTGEEQDYLGSFGYVRQHFGDAETMALKPEHAKLSAYFNLDNGSGKIRGIDMQGNEAARPLFTAWLAPFKSVGASTVTILNTGGTDHLAFDAVGLPGFNFIQDPLNYEARPHHSNLDTYEQALPDDLKQASFVLASLVYHVAMHDTMIPRKPLPKPHATAATGAR